MEVKSESEDIKPDNVDSQLVKTSSIPINVQPVEISVEKIPRPPNAFMIFGKEYRRILAKKFPEFSNKQISKILGDEWKKMSGERKNHYHKLADETHKEHLVKYPGYYYSPLEARQRKAERKLKSKMTRNGRKPDETPQTFNARFTYFGANSPFVMRGSYPMVRPMFGTPMPVGHRMSQPMFHYGSHQTFGGFVPQITFGGFRQQSGPAIALHNEHNYASVPQQPQQSAQLYVHQMSHNYQINTSSQTNESGEQNNQNFIYKIQNPDLSALMTNYLPPMHNPSTEVTQVVENEIEKQIKCQTEVTKMANVSPDDEIHPTSEPDQLISPVFDETLVKTEAKVIVKRVDEGFDELMATNDSAHVSDSFS